VYFRKILRECKHTKTPPLRLCQKTKKRQRERSRKGFLLRTLAHPEKGKAAWKKTKRRFCVIEKKKDKKVKVCPPPPPSLASSSSSSSSSSSTFYSSSPVVYSSLAFEASSSVLSLSLSRFPFARASFFSLFSLSLARKRKKNRRPFETKLETKRRRSSRCTRTRSSFLLAQRCDFIYQKKYPREIKRRLSLSLFFFFVCCVCAVCVRGYLSL